jgi:hypothetical protein
MPETQREFFQHYPRALCDYLTVKDEQAPIKNSNMTVL